MPGKGQVIVGVLVEVEISKNGALLVQEEVTKDPELVCVCRKLLLAGIVVRLPHQSVPEPTLLGNWPVGGSVKVVCWRFAECHLAFPAEPIQLEVFKEEGGPAPIPKLLWTDNVITNSSIAIALPTK